MCASMLRCVAVCCNVLQCLELCLGMFSVSASVLQCVAVCCIVLHCVAVCCCVFNFVLVQTVSLSKLYEEKSTFLVKTAYFLRKEHISCGKGIFLEFDQRKGTFFLE